MRDFRTLLIWHKAHALTLAIYPATQDFPDEERYGLMARIRRVCTSIPAHIANGCAYSTDVDFATSLTRAMGYACALESDLLLARDLGFLNDLAFETLEHQLVEMKKMLGGLLRQLRGDGIWQ